MMNLFLVASADPEDVLTIIGFVLGLIFFIIFINMIIKFFGMAKNLKKISEDLSDVLAILKKNR